MIDILKEKIQEQIDGCNDADLLDLIWQLLIAQG